MTNNINNQEIEPNDEGTLTGAFNTLTSQIKRTIEKSLPVEVTAVSDDRKTVTVKPLIKLLDAAGKSYTRAPIVDVPVITTGGGGYVMSFNVEVGDKGWIETSDRDISIYKQQYNESAPNTRRMHSYSDARFIPDVMSGIEIDSGDASAIVIQKLDGSVKISMSDDKIVIKHPTAIELETQSIDFKISGQFKVEADSMDFSANNAIEFSAVNYNVTTSNKADINGATINGSGEIESPALIKGANIEGTSDVTADGLSLKTHKHPAGTLLDSQGSPVTGDTGVGV
jgi:hypothetical protein